jgi:hypothetical protein
MAIYLVVDKQSSIIVNVIEWDGATPYTPPEGDVVDLIHYPDGASPGWTWDAGRAVDSDPREEIAAVRPAEVGGMVVDP